MSHLSIVLQTTACPACGREAVPNTSSKAVVARHHRAALHRTSGHCWQHGREVALGTEPSCLGGERVQHQVGEAAGSTWPTIFTFWNHVCLTLRHPAL